MNRYCWPKTSLLAVAYLLSCFVVLSNSTSTVYFRQQTGGSIFTIDGRDGSQTELEGSREYARFIGMAMHRRTGRIFWSDGRAVHSASAVDGSDATIIIGALVRAVWVGANFGESQDDIQALTVKGTRCESIISWLPGRVECIVGLPQRFSQLEISDTDFLIQTTQGSMRGSVLDFAEMVASGTPAPIVKHIDVDTNYILPHALAIDDREARDWLYWSNSADGTIYRSSLHSTAIEVLQDHCWSVRGLALNMPQSPALASSALFYSLESKGIIAKIDLPESDMSITAPPTAQVILSGLRSPRGLAVDLEKQFVFFTEKTGRIFQIQLDKGFTARHQGQVLPDDASIVAPGIDVRRIVTQTSMTRLDGIAVDSKYLYWCETNSNTIARASRRDFQREVLVGGTANSQLSWPRGIVLGSDDGDVNENEQSYYYSEYTGRISRGAAQTAIIDAVTAPAMQYLDSVVRKSVVQAKGGHVYFYALE